MQRLLDYLLVASVILEVCEAGYCVTRESARPYVEEVLGIGSRATRTP